jgi:ATP-dependent Lon protease
MNSDDHERDDAGCLAEDDVATTGAAADSAERDDRLQRLPRLLRYAILSGRNRSFAVERLIAEIVELCPDLAMTYAWTAARGLGAGLALAGAIDHRAAATDRPDLRNLSDAVRLLYLKQPELDRNSNDYRRVAKSLLLSLRQLSGIDGELAAEIEEFCFGWAALSNSKVMLPNAPAAAAAAARALGEQMARRRVAAAKAELKRTFAEERDARQRKSGAPDAAASSNAVVSSDAVVLVCRMDEEAIKVGRVREVVDPLKSVVNTPLPLMPVPPLAEVRHRLRLEFPYAGGVIDSMLAELVGRTSVRLAPTLLVGPPGGGKSRFCRRLTELLGVLVWRCDASQSDGATFGGTDRRWHSVQPCHALLAVARAGHANPVILLDELDKPATRTDYGRLWDSLLGFLEPETARRYPDPALQTMLDLSHISYLATANSADPLPVQLRDRFRILAFPRPGLEDLDRLLPAVVADLAAERGLDLRWVEPLDASERDLAAEAWRGASIRRLRDVVGAILRHREAVAVRH